MRHQNKRHRLGRGAPHRKATLAALSNALIRHKKIVTTQAKAKALRVFVEPIISRSKEDSTHNRRQVFRHLQDKESVKELFGEIAEKVGDRPGGYTRVIKLGQRHGDAAPMAVIELVDYNDVRPEGASSGKKKTRRGRTRRASKAATAISSAAATVADKVEDVADAVVDSVEDAVEAVGDAVEEAADAVEDKVEDVKEAVADVVVEDEADGDEAESDASDEGEAKK